MNIDDPRRGSIALSPRHVEQLRALIARIGMGSVSAHLRSTRFTLDGAIAGQRFIRKTVTRLEAALDEIEARAAEGREVRSA